MMGSPTRDLEQKANGRTSREWEPVKPTENGSRAVEREKIPEKVVEKVIDKQIDPTK
jgi:hypothetical protein